MSGDDTVTHDRVTDDSVSGNDVVIDDVASAEVIFTDEVASGEDIVTDDAASGEDIETHDIVTDDFVSGEKKVTHDIVTDDAASAEDIVTKMRRVPTPDPYLSTFVSSRWTVKSEVMFGQVTSLHFIHDLSQFVTTNFGEAITKNGETWGKVQTGREGGSPAENPGTQKHAPR